MTDAIETILAQRALGHCISALNNPLLAQLPAEIAALVRQAQDRLEAACAALPAEAAEHVRYHARHADAETKALAVGMTEDAAASYACACVAGDIMTKAERAKALAAYAAAKAQHDARAALLDIDATLSE